MRICMPWLSVLCSCASAVMGYAQSLFTLTQGFPLKYTWGPAQRRQGEAGAVRFLLRKGLEANPRSRYVYLSWALWEKKQGQLDDARRLFERGCKLNPSDTALLQVRSTLLDAL